MQHPEMVWASQENEKVKVLDRFARMREGMSLGTVESSSVGVCDSEVIGVCKDEVLGVQEGILLQ